MTRGRLDKWCENGILCVVLAILIFGPLATGAVRTRDFLVIQLLVVAAVFLWLLRLWLNPSVRLLWPPICWAVVAFVAYAILRYQQADIEYVARQELLRIICYAILFFVVLNNCVDQKSTLTISYVLIGVAMLNSMYAIYQFATHSDHVWNFARPAIYTGRGSGTYINPNHLAGFLEMVLPLGLAYVLVGRLSHLPRIFLGYASCVILAGIGVSLSRGGWLAAAGSLSLLFVVLIRKRQYRIPTLILLAVLGLGSAVFYSKTYLAQRRINQLLVLGAPDDIHSRFWLWDPAIKMWHGHLWFGVGPGHFDYRFPAFRPVTVQSRPAYVHNDYLNCLVDWGVTGTVLVAAAWALYFVGVFKTWKYSARQEGGLENKPSNRAAFVLGATAAVVAILIHSVCDFNMQIPANAILAITLMALVSGHLRFATERYWVQVGWAGRILATLVCATGIIYLVLQGRQKAEEYRWLRRARTETVPGRKLDDLKRAASVEPSNFETSFAIGETLRQLSWQANSGFEKLAVEAVEWFRRGMHSNPFDAHNYLGVGMSLDWLGRHDEAAPFFEEAVQLDPNNYYVQAHQGWHFVQTGDFEKAQFWFKRSWSVNWWDNPIAKSYLVIVERKLKEAQPSKQDLR